MTSPTYGAAAVAGAGLKDGSKSESILAALGIADETAATARPSLVEYARYAMSQGWDPLPVWGVGPDGVCACRLGVQCKTAGKHPLENRWQSRDRASIPDAYEWWGNPTHPTNIGLRTGEPSGVWVLDIDPKSGGDHALRELEARYGALPTTRVHRTGSGGHHYLFRLPSDFAVTNSRGQLPAGIDVRGNGGFVVAPGSVSGVGSYATESDADVASAPEWLLDLIRPQAPAATVAVVESAAFGSLDAGAQLRARQYLDSAIAGEIERLDAMKLAATSDASSYRGEPWNETVYKVCCNLLELAQSDWLPFGVDDAKAILRDHAPTDAGFTAVDVLGRLNSAANMVRGKLRPMPSSIVEDDWALLTAHIVSQEAAHPGDADLIGSGDKGKAMTRRDDRDGDPLFRKAKNGGYSINATVFRDYLFGRGPMPFEPLAVDDGDGVWTYRAGAFVQDRNAISQRAQTILGDYYTPSAKGLAKDLVIASGMARRIDFNEARHPELVNFRNTMLDWRTGETLPHDPAHLSTFQVSCAWDPNADCAKFGAYVDTMLSPEAARLLWQVIGYTLLSGNPMQVVVYLVGSGGNGKGVIVRVLEGLLGPENTSALTLLEIDGDNRFKLAQLVGKAANISGETTGGYIKDSVNLKRASGGDFLDMERKGMNGFQARVPATLIFSINEAPHFGDDSDGLSQRGIVIPFNRKVSEHRIAGFNEADFVSEFSGIARCAIEAARTIRIDEPALRAEGFALVPQAQRKFAEATNAELYWLSNHARRKTGHWVTSAELWRAFGGKGERASRKFMRTLNSLYGDTIRNRVPSAVAAFNPSGARARVCYEVEYGEDPFPAALGLVPEAATAVAR